MSIPADQLVESALSLPQSDRAQLAMQLLHSLTPPGEEISHQELGDELRKRVERHRAGELSSLSLEEARSAIEQALSRRPAT